MRNKTINALLAMGMPADIKGFGYIVEAMCLFEEDARRKGKLTRIYCEIGKRNEIAGSCVERTIRYAFENVLKNGNEALVQRYLPVGHTTNGNRLHTLYFRLTQEE